jgi:1-acyl-sn-glycerol-3-phosphate acyltransferase
MRKNYLWYQFCRHTIVGNGLKFFYKRIIVTGREHLPKNKPILFVPNHQNSFMDALLVATQIKPTLYFLTRAQAFNPPFVGWLLGSLNMLPVYRVRDGFSSIQKNNAIFEQCFQYMRENDCVLIFAEANHNLKKRIRPLSKGFTRVAFGSEEKFDWQLDVQIVPVGVNYTAHRDARNTIRVCYGEPIPVSRYKDAYLADDIEASQQMKEDVKEAMEQLVFHVPELDDYYPNKILWDELEPDELKITDPDIARERIKQTKPHLTESIKEQAKELDSLSGKYDIKLKNLFFGKKPGIKDVMLAPFYLFSLINNVVPYQPVRLLIKNIITDPAFDASIKFLAGILIIPLFYILVSVVLLLAGVNGFIVLGYALLSILTAPLFIRAKELLTKNNVQKLKDTHPETYEKMQAHLEAFQKLRKSILETEFD